MRREHGGGRREEGGGSCDEGGGTRGEEGRGAKDEGAGSRDRTLFYLARASENVIGPATAATAFAVPHCRRRAPSTCASLPSPCLTPVAVHRRRVPHCRRRAPQNNGNKSSMACIPSSSEPGSGMGGVTCAGTAPAAGPAPGAKNVVSAGFGTGSAKRTLQ